MVINGSSSKIADDKALMYPYIDYTNSNFIDNLPKNKENNILILGAGGFTIGLNDVRNHYVFLDVIGQLPHISEEHFLHQNLTDNK